MEGNYAMATTMPYIQWWKGSYRFRRPIPREHQATFGNKAYFPTKPLGTTDKAEANRLVLPHIEKTNWMLKLAKAGEWPAASDEMIALIAYKWLGSLNSEEPFDNEGELVGSFRQ